MALSLRSGLAGAVTVTALHQLTRAVTPLAPRMDTLGRRGLSRVLRTAGVRPPRGRKLQRWALAADLASNTLFYALAGGSWWRGLALGAAAGYGAVEAPPRLLLGWAPTRKTRTTKQLAFGLYLLGGIAAVLWARRRG